MEPNVGTPDGIIKMNSLSAYTKSYQTKYYVSRNYIDKPPEHSSFRNSPEHCICAKEGS